MNETLLQQAGGAFTEWQTSLVAKKSKEDRERYEQPQLELQETILEGRDALTGYLRSKLRIDDAHIDAPPFPRDALSSSEYHDPPIQLETDSGVAWDKQIQAREASQPLFWLLCHIVWLSEGRFDSDPLASYFYRANKHIDDQTRDFLRRTGGVPREIRGAVTVFADCTLARAWWRYQISAAAAGAGELTRDKAHAAIRGAVWAPLVEMAVKRVTVINQPRARAALIAELIERDKPDRKTVQQIATALARHGLNRSLEHTPWDELRKITASAAE